MPSGNRCLRGETALVTGGSRGIGAAAALALARRGADVCVHFHQAQASARQTVAACEAFGARAVALQADLTRPDDIANLATTTHAALGPVSILVNNAGVAHTALAIDTSDDMFDRLLALHVKAPFTLSRQMLPHMIRARRGCIVNVSSIWGLTGAAGEVAYSAAKGGLIALTKALAKEMGPSGIRVNAVAPGAIETDMLRDLADGDKESLCQMTPLGRLGTPEDVARVIAFLASPDAAFITGQVVSPNGGLLI